MTDPFQKSKERVVRTDLVVPIGTNQKKVAGLALAHQTLDQINRSTVEPLQIVQEQNKRMFGARKHCDQAPEHKLKAVPLFVGRDVGSRRQLLND
jgi:hypothetical protein